MIQNIQNLQNPVDLRYLNKNLSTEYLLQALANLGQRMGMKGDSILYSGFKFQDVLENRTLPQDKENYIGYVKYYKDEASDIYALVGLTEKSNMLVENERSTALNINSVDYNIFDSIEISDDVSLDMIINNVNTYNKNSIIKYENGELVTMLFGLRLGTNYDEKNNCEIIYNRFDINTNVLNQAIRCFYLYELNKVAYYCLMNLTKNESDSNYTLMVYFYTISINDPNIDEYVDYFTLKEDDDFKTLSNYINENNIDDIDTVFGKIINNTNIRNIKNEFTIYYDTENNQLLSDKSQLDQRILKYFDDDNDFSKRIEYINNDITYLYPAILKIYNNLKFTYSKQVLYKNILYSLYEELLKEVNKYDDPDNSINTYNTLYIPLDYNFHYICNTTNEFNLYFSNEIHISLFDSSKYNEVGLEDLLSKDQCLFFDYEEIKTLHVKNKVYRFEIEYNTKYTEYINDINVDLVYTLPYIDANNEWVINDVPTGITSIGKSYGNPNIIILYEDSDSYKVLNQVTNIDSFDFSYNDFYYIKSSKVFADNQNYPDILKVNVQMPIVDDSNIDALKDSIIFCISNLNCLDTYNVNNEYTIKYLTSIWILGESNEGINKFIPLANPNDSSDVPDILDLVTFFDASIVGNDILNKMYHNVIFDCILFNSKRKIELDSIPTTDDMYYMIAKSKGGEELRQELLDSITVNGQSIPNSNKYDATNNNLTMTLEYNKQNKVQVNGSTVSSTVLEDSNKLFSTSNINFTNVLYPKYNVTANVTYTSEISYNYITSNRWIRQTKYISYNDYTGTLENERSNALTYFSYTTSVVKQPIKSGVVSQTNYKISDIDYWNEYTFNYDVPTLDLKELFLVNSNTLNRINIITLNNDVNDGNIYYSYMGSTWNDNNKSTLHIGTSTHNINLGVNTLVKTENNYIVQPENSSTKFKKQDAISIDFDDIILNSNVPVKVNYPSLTRTTVNTNNYNVINYNDLIVSGSSIEILSQFVGNVGSNTIDFNIIKEETDQNYIASTASGNIYYNDRGMLQHEQTYVHADLSNTKIQFIRLNDIKEVENDDLIFGYNYSMLNLSNIFDNLGMDPNNIFVRTVNAIDNTVHYPYNVQFVTDSTNDVNEQQVQIKDFLLYYRDEFFTNNSIQQNINNLLTTQIFDKVNNYLKVDKIYLLVKSSNNIGLVPIFDNTYLINSNIKLIYFTNNNKYYVTILYNTTLTEEERNHIFVISDKFLI